MTPKNEELLGRILSFARKDKGVRALALIGSSVNGEGRNDEYSDIDFILVTESPARFLGSASWAESIGPVWFSFAESVPDANHYERRFLFEGALDADFVVIEKSRLVTSPETLAVAREICAGGVRVILDKDGLEADLNGLVGEPREFSFPSASDFENLVQDFYFHCLWATKKRLRGEYWVALQCVNGYLKRKTLAMLEWYERSLRGKEYDTRYDGRYLERWIEDDLRDDLARSFATYDEEGMRAALDATARLFTKVARATAAALSYPFPEAAVAGLAAGEAQTSKTSCRPGAISGGAGVRIFSQPSWSTSASVASVFMLKPLPKNRSLQSTKC